MSGWAVLNWGAWAVSAIIAVIILVDFLRVEKRNKHRAERRHDPS
jgi:hypothetical protein